MFIDQAIEELKNGWIKGDYETEHGVCALGACGKVADQLRGDRDRFEDEEALRISALKCRVEDEIDAIVREQYPDRLNSDGGLVPIAAFNDHPDTKLEEVIAVFEKAKARLEEEG
jgi:hypothetical protein